MGTPFARGGLTKNAVVMDWIGGGNEAASQGHDVVITPAASCYFSRYQSTNHAVEPRARGYIPLEQAYSFEPVRAELAPEFQVRILGAQGSVWTEYIPNLQHIDL